MTDSLNAFAADIASAWGPLTSELVQAATGEVAKLARSPTSEAWLAALHRDLPARVELLADPAHGFVLLAHAEPAGLYRAPHDHGRGWVIYAVLSGTMEMGSYVAITGADGISQLVKRNAIAVGPGQVQVYLPGDIHDTRCLAGPALLLRFSDRDLQHEDRVAHQVTRYVERGGRWSAERA